MEIKSELISSSRFIEIYKGWDSETKKRISDEVCRACGIAMSTLFYKNRTNSWKHLELKAAQEVLERNGISVEDVC